LSRRAASRLAMSPKHQIRLRTDKPDVYIAFVRFGKREPLDAGESNEGVWLRLYNNTRWQIWVPAFDVPRDAGEIGLRYEISRPVVRHDLHFGPEDRPKADTQGSVPVGYNYGDTRSWSPIKSGESVLFSTPREHLPPGTFLQLRFKYGWEDS